MGNDDKYSFKISLNVLNHLGRNLYRNIETIIGEAISNSWDADAKNVWIEIKRNKLTDDIYIIDDGCGMNSDDFQNKFLRIGYSKRKKYGNLSKKNRKFIGQKGIGKLALLSCSKKIVVCTKKDGCEITGGLIDNDKLDDEITEDNETYYLDSYKLSSLEKKIEGHGTVIYLKNIHDGVYHKEDYFKKVLALYFKFSLYDEEFNIFVNGDRITENQLADLSNDTQFLWNINNCKDPFIDTFENLVNVTNVNSKLSINGYIASVKKPSQLTIRSFREKVTIDLFVNGRMREKNILQHVPTNRLFESYLYGQIHFDILDNDVITDRFTSNREGVIADDPLYKQFLGEISSIINKIRDQWDELRLSNGDEGDSENEKMPLDVRKAIDLTNIRFKQFITEDNKHIFSGKGIVSEWRNEIIDEAQFNIPSYADCYISENLLRKYIKYKNFNIGEDAEELILRHKNNESDLMKSANKSFDIRKKDDKLLYLEMADLAEIIDSNTEKDKRIIKFKNSSYPYRLVRNAVCHTALITQQAKTLLNLEYENIKSAIIKLLENTTKD